MTQDPDGFAFMASLPAAELARLRRRIAFLEGAVLQMLREDQQLREWYSAADLAALRLPGLPLTASGVAGLARRERWDSRIVRGRGGERVQFHFAALPRAAFAAFIELVVRGASARGEEAGTDGTGPAAVPELPAPDLPPVAPGPPASAGNAMPQWVLPLVRLLRGGAPSLKDALRALPNGWPPGLVCPSAAEARETLRALGLLAG